MLVVFLNVIFQENDKSFFVGSVIANFIVSWELVENDDSGDCYWQKFYSKTILKKKSCLFVCFNLGWIPESPYFIPTSQRWFWLSPVIKSLNYLLFFSFRTFIEAVWRRSVAFGHDLDGNATIRWRLRISRWTAQYWRSVSFPQLWLQYKPFGSR